MKNIIISILAATLGVSAFAKTSSELAAEYNALKAEGSTQWEAGGKVYGDNAKDIPALFEEWKGTNSAKFTPTEEPNKGMTKAQKDESLALRAIFAQYLVANPNQIAKTPVRTACLAVSSRCVAAMAESNPTFYDELKSAKFVVDGIELPAYSRLNLAKGAGDTEYIKSVSVADGMCAPDAYLGVVIDLLLKSNDISAAKDKCRELENYLLKKQAYSSEHLSRVQAVNKALTSRLVDAKIQGK